MIQQRISRGPTAPQMCSHCSVRSDTDSSVNICKYPCQGSILLWLYWPSFNALFAEADARHRWKCRNIIITTDSLLYRAYINTYISLLSATVCTFIASAIFGSGRRFQAVDVQNATLAGLSGLSVTCLSSCPVETRIITQTDLTGGVIVGATADLMLQPYGAFLAGSVGGLVATFGYQVP